MSSAVAVPDTEDQQALVGAVGGLLARQWGTGAARKAIDDPGSVSERTLWLPLAGLGIAGLPVAESSGGSGGGWADLAVALEALGGALAPVPAVAAAGVLGALGSLPDGPAARLLPGICEGTTIATIAWTRGDGMWGCDGQFRTEPASASDIVRVSGGASPVLSPEADLVLVRAESDRGPMLVQVAATARGVRIERLGGLDLLRPVGALTLDDAEGTVLAQGAPAVAALRRSLVTGSAALASDLVGLAAHCLDSAVAYANQREQFGRPVGAFQAVKHKCADMLTQVELARAAARNIAELLDAGASADDLDQAAALALLKATEAARQVSADYIQILGGIGFTWEHEAHLYYRRAGAAAPLFGGVTTHLDRIDPMRARPGTGGPATARYREGTPAAELGAQVAALLPLHREKWGDDDSFPARLDWQRRLHAAGWIAPQWPAEFGGRSLGIVDQVECDQVLAELRAPSLAGVLGVSNVAPALMHYGTAQQQRHLLGIQSGAEVWCQGFSEPGAGSDLASLRTLALLDDGEFAVNGQKIWTSEGMEATHCLLLARTDPQAKPHRGISALLVPMDAPGITRRPITQITGEGGFAEVFLDDVRVPRSALLGPLHQGWQVTMTTLGFERAGVIMLAGRLEQTVYDLTTALRGRQLDPHLRADLASRLADARALRLLGRRALGRITDGGAPGPEHSVIKLAWSTTMQAIGATHLAALGLDGITTTRGQQAQHDYLMSRSATIAGGTTEIMRNILAERVLGMPR
jgi:alkylation response protein AidB-like acyl-CoA dehydrogenase